MNYGSLRRGGSITTHPFGRRTSGSPSISFRFDKGFKAAGGLRSAASVCAALVAMALFLVGGRSALAGANISHFTLDNGLEVVVIPDHRTPVVTHMVWYKVGSADEDAGKTGLAHFLEHLMFKGTDEESAGRFSQVARHHRRPGERLHHRRLHRIFPAHRPRISADRDGVRGRPHDRPRADRRQCAARARRGAGRIQHARRQQPGGAARRAGHRGALSQSSLWTPGDRLAPRDREAQPRGRARVLPALLHAQQRGGGDRRRRHRRGGQGRSPRRPTARWPSAPRSVRASGPRSRRRSRCARSRSPMRASRSRACSAAISCPPTTRRSRARPKRSKCSPRCSAAARPAGSTARS